MVGVGLNIPDETAKRGNIWNETMYKSMFNTQEDVWDANNIPHAYITINDQNGRATTSDTQEDNAAWSSDLRFSRLNQK